MPMTPKRHMEGARLAAWRALLTAQARLVPAIERELEAGGVMSLTWYDALLTLYEAPDRRLRMNELAEAVVLSPSGLTRLVDRLEAEGLLRREACGEDRRCQYAVITRKGLAGLRETWPVYAKAIAKHFGDRLDDGEIEALRGALSRVLESPVIAR